MPSDFPASRAVGNPFQSKESKKHLAKLEYNATRRILTLIHSRHGTRNL
jgi:hypothetical protein